MSLAGKFKRAAWLWQNRGFLALAQNLKAKAKGRGFERDYQKWVQRYGTISDNNLAALANEIGRFPHQPLISVVLPVYNVDEKWLRLCIESVRRQVYQNWELCVADDASPQPHIKPILKEYRDNDPRIKVVFRSENGHISAASNSALELASGELAVLLDHDDELSEDALFWVAKEANEHPETAMIYSDEDLIDERGRRSEPKFKPDWSPDLFYSLNLITHLSAYRTDLLKSIGGFRAGLEGSQDYDLALRVIEQISEDQIRHIPRVLYHWRAIHGSVAFDADEKPYAHERAREAIREHFQRAGVKAAVTKGFNTLHRVIYDLPEDAKISVITASPIQIAYTNVETLTTDGASASAFNLAAKKAGGDVLVFLESGIKQISIETLRELTAQALRKEIGAVGAKVLYSNSVIHHSGVIVGMNGLVGFPHQGMPQEAPGNFLRIQVAHNLSAVSGGCLAIRKEVFEELGGLDTEDFEGGFFDIDLCLRARAKGYRIVWTPYAELTKDDDCATEKSLKNADLKERAAIKQKWKSVIECDPYYNPNFSKEGEPFNIKL